MGIFSGTSTSDVITGNNVSAGVSRSPEGSVPSAAADWIYGHGGDDILSGEGGNDHIYGGLGNDFINGWDGSNIIYGQSPYYYTQLYGSEVLSRAGDEMMSRAVQQIAEGFSGYADIDVGREVAFIGAQDSDDTPCGRISSSPLGVPGVLGDAHGALLHDVADGPIVDAMPWIVPAIFRDSDVIVGGDGDDVIYGGTGRPNAWDGPDEIHGLGGNDVIYGEGGADQIIGYSGNDAILGGAGDDGLEGGSGNDIVMGGTGDDRVFDSEGGNDFLAGNQGRDYLYGGEGRDTLIGGADDDVFDFSYVSDSKPGAAGRDVIVDFTGAGVEGGDLIDLWFIDYQAPHHGYDGLTFVGTNPIAGLGDVRAAPAPGDPADTLIQVNTSGGLAPELEILVENVSPGDWIAGDFFWD